MVKVLVISRGPWSSDNNTGNTLNNLFSGFDDAEIHNLYFREEKPGKNPCKSIFRISEKQLVKSIRSRKPCGAAVEKAEAGDDGAKKEKAIYDAGKKMNLYTPWLIREWIWSLGKWKRGPLDGYVDGIAPDLIFMPVFGCWYPHKVLRYISRLPGAEKAKIILFHGDDNYTLKQYRFSPVFWIFRLILRKWVRRSVKIADVNCCISDLQKEEYEKAFGREFVLLRKKGDFSGEPKLKASFNSPLKLVYTGNVSTGRWETLEMIARSLDTINADGVRAGLHVYTGNPLTEKMKRAFDSPSLVFHGSAPSEQMGPIQEDADILVHVESFTMKHKLRVRQSFSTKIVDYLGKGRCILAAGPADVASLKYFLDNGAAFTATDKKTFKDRIGELVSMTPEELNAYAEKAWDVGRTLHGEDADSVKSIYREMIAESGGTEE
ncbi:MAG: hypothetical protein IJM71_00280 [Clostridia bacterium]|nr:hypothetical protein [Clostridia bacterium]